MNNSRIALEYSEEKPDTTPLLRERQATILRIIEAIQEIEKTKAWSTLKTEIFHGLDKLLDNELRAEAKKEQPDPSRLNRLAGQLHWAERYADLSKLEERYRTELKQINQRIELHG